MIRPLYRTRNVIAAVEDVRARHHWARQPVKLKHITAILAEENIKVVHAPIRSRAYIHGGDGTFIITMRRKLDPNVRAKVLLHEYAHAKLHLTERGEVVRQLMPCTKGDPRELEADLFAALLWFGPKATPDDPAIAKLVARLEGAVHMQHAPQQLALPMPEPRPKPRIDRRHGKPAPAPHPADREPQFTHLREVFDDLSRPIAERRKAWLEHLARQPKRMFKAITHDEMLFDWETHDGKPLRYFHLQHGWIDIYDGRRIETTDGKMKWQIIKCGDARAERRTFIISTEDRRRYEFKKRESRGRAPKQLDAQIEKATRMSAKSQERSVTERTKTEVDQ